MTVSCMCKRTSERNSETRLFLSFVTMCLTSVLSIFHSCVYRGGCRMSTSNALYLILGEGLTLSL